MLIVLGVYAALVWLIFFQLKILPWNVLTKIAVSVVGLGILLTFMALLNTRTPSGRVIILSPMGDVASVVSGTVAEILVETHQNVKKDDPLFRLDKRPFEFARDQTKANFEFARISYKRIEAAIEKNPNTFSRQHRDEARAKFEAASAALEIAKYDLDRTQILAVADGQVGPVEIRVGDRISAYKPMISLIRRNDARVWGVFQQNGRSGVAVGHEVAIAMRQEPGVVHWSKVIEIAPAAAVGSVGAGTQVAGLGVLGGAEQMIVVLDWPKDLPRESVMIGSSGTATIIGPDSGAIGSLASILIRVKAIMNYF